jgi:DNA gyrase subunit A
MAEETNKTPENDKPEGKNEEIEEIEGAENEEMETEEELEENISFAKDLRIQNISTEMETSYLAYAMSVIVSRALPDVRDGMKPVHRRILYAMHDIGLKSTASFRKSAAVVGEVLGKYHPHGDTAVYDSMVRMAQDFSLRYTLVRGQGNFGSVDGDSAAAMRYTEAKLEKISDEILADIDKETVVWNPNYDGRYKEPSVLPTKIPNLLLNGTTGIAVGMATSIPPHNLSELIDALFYLIENSEATIEELMEFIHGPDFPTGGKIYDVEAIKTAYVTGRGGVTMRAKAEIEERKNGKFAIIVNEIPYQVNKANLVLKIADLVRDKKIVGISDIRDESNREGMRIVVELKKDSFPRKILNQLYKLTAMQTNFNFNMIALVDGIQPKLLNIKQILEYFLKHRQEVITNRTKYELRIAEERAHILEGLQVALDNIDAVIHTIRKSGTKEEAHEALMKKFKLSDRQAQAILEMRLQTLAGLERQKIENEYKEKLTLIEELKSILADPQKILNIIKEELAYIKEKYGDERKTEVIPHGIGKFSSKDTIPNEPMIVMLSKEGYIKRVPPSTFKSQHRGGKGIIGGTTKDEDEMKIIRHGKNHDNILFFTTKGRVFQLPVYEIPKTSRTAKGQPVVNLLQLGEDEKVSSFLIIRGEKFKGEFLIMATKKGTVKKTAVEAFKNVRKSGLIAIKLREKDTLEWVKQVSAGEQVMIITKKGKGIRFDEKDCRSMGRASMGVRGIRVKTDDEVVEMDVINNPENELMVIMENGLGKSSKIKNYRLQKRGGTGVKTAKLTAKTGDVVGAKIVTGKHEDDLIIISKKGQTIRLKLKDIPSLGRATQGVYLMRMKGGDKVSSISIIKLVEVEKGVEEAQKEATEEKKAEVEILKKGEPAIVEEQEEELGETSENNKEKEKKQSGKEDATPAEEQKKEAKPEKKEPKPEKKEPKKTDDKPKKPTKEVKSEKAEKKSEKKKPAKKKDKDNPAQQSLL